MSTHFTLLGFALILASTSLDAQPAGDRAHIRGSTEPTRRRLDDAAKKIAAGQHADAIDDLQRILDDAGDDLTTTDGSHFRPARWHAHALLATLPPTPLATYRNRIDGPAKLLLERAKRDRDPTPLWMLLDRYFVSRPAEEALRLLGDMLFERGEVRTAEVVWKRLVPSSQPDIAYPTPAASEAAGDRARLVLAAIFQGDIERAKSGLAELKAAQPGAAGSLAGATGPFAATLESLLAKTPSFPRDPRLPGTWPTLAAGPSRDGRITGRLPKHWPSRPTWTATLPPNRPALKGLRPAARLPHYDPVIVDGRVILSDGMQVFSIDSRTGARPQMLLELDGLGAVAPQDATRIYLCANQTNSRGVSETRLVCLAVGSAGGKSSLLKLWSIKPPGTEGGPVSDFMGPPLVADRRLWVVLARAEGGRVVHSVASYEPADSVEGFDRPAWLTEISDATVAAASEEPRRNVPTLAGRHVVVCTHSGAVVALDAATGRRAWAFRYPRVASTAPSAEFSPPAFHAGRVFVAPADSDRIFALDAETGEPLWESGPCENAHILGVTRGRVIVSVEGRVPGVRGLSMKTGSHREPEGWVQHRPGIPASFGSGLVTDDAIFWPTKSGLFVLNPESGESLGQPLRPVRDPQDNIQPAASFGPIAFADGCLVAIVPTVINGIARDQVWGYVCEEK